MDEKQFNELYRRVRQSVRGTLLEFDHSYDEVDALEQDVWAAVWESRDSFSKDSALDTWVLGIAKNIGRNHVRTQLRSPEIQYHDPVDGGDGEVDGFQFPDQYVYNDEEADALVRYDQFEEVFNQLPPRVREVAELRAEGLTISEIADHLGIAQGTAARYLAEAKEALIY